MDLRKAFVSYCAALMKRGVDPVATCSGEVDNSWFARGVRELTALFGLVEGDTEAGFVVGRAYAAGAVSALRLARVLMSDPALKGRELDALRLAEDGLDHGAILARLRSNEITAPASVGSNVVTMPRRSAAAANS